MPPPAALPPANSPPVVYLYGPCFEAQGGASVIEPETYLYYIQLKPSQPSQGNWTPYNEETEKIIREDFLRLWNTNFLDNLSIEKEEYTFSNGVVGELITYHMEERQRVKIVDYVGTKAIETSKIDEGLKMAMAEIRLDTFIDPALVRKVSGHRARHAEGQGLPERRGHAGDRADAGRAEARAPHLPHVRGAEGQDQEDRVHGQQGVHDEPAARRR